ncbi:MAG TPA: TonB-dependent receptor [Vicinamibacteria bacterium]|nr:TonB-dependent receptor [Vicinamibacteria bacterium]
MASTRGAAAEGFLVAAALGLWLSTPSRAAACQPAPADVATGTIWGAALAPDGARLPGVRVTLLRREGGSLRVESGPLGIYRAGGLPPGTWTLTAESSGFAPLRVDGVVLAPGESHRQDLRLALAGVSERVTVASPVPSESIEATAIGQDDARDLGEALAAIPGLWPLRKGGIASDVVMRGLQSRDLTVVVDGERVYGACPNHMDPPPFHVDLAEVERVEVGKGPFDVRNQGSLGGVVEVVTRDPDQGFHLVPTLSLGSFSYLNPSFTASWAGPSLAALAGISWRGARADRDGDGRRFTERTNYLADAADDRAFAATAGWGRLKYSSAGGATVEASYARQHAEKVFYPYLQMDAVDDTTDRASARFESRRQRRTISLLTAQIYLTRVGHWMTDEWRASSSGTPRGYSMGTLASALTWGARAGARVGRTTAGLEFYHRYWDASTEMAGMQYAPQPSIPGVTVDVLGAFAEYSRILGDRVLLEAGGRLDAAWSAADAEKARTDLAFAYLGTRELARTEVAPSGKLRASWRPGTGLQLALGIGHTARVPEASERFFALRRAGSDWVGNPDLEPSRNSGGELSLAWRRARFWLKASAFADRIADFITVADVERRNEVPGVTNTSARTWRNVDATLTGGELSASFVLAGRLFLSGELSSVRGSQQPRPEAGIFSRVLPEIPPLRGRLGVRFDDGRWFAAVDGVAAGAQGRVDADLLEQPTAGYAIMNAAVGWRRGGGALTWGLQNAFDRCYAPHLSYQRDPFRSGARVYDPGRTLYANASWRF